jgi:hypothetical protein
MERLGTDRIFFVRWVNSLYDRLDAGCRHFIARSRRRNHTAFFLSQNDDHLRVYMFDRLVDAAESNGISDVPRRARDEEIAQILFEDEFWAHAAVGAAKHDYLRTLSLGKFFTRRYEWTRFFPNAFRCHVIAATAPRLDYRQRRPIESFRMPLQARAMKQICVDKIAPRSPLSQKRSTEILNAPLGTNHVEHANGKFVFDHDGFTVGHELIVDQNIERLADHLIELDNRPLIEFEQTFNRHAGPPQLYRDLERHIHQKRKIDLHCAFTVGVIFTSYFSHKSIRPLSGLFVVETKVLSNPIAISVLFE